MGNENRMGKISAIDYAAGMVRVVYHEKDDAVTRPIPLISSEYFMPEIGDLVLVVHLSNGTEAGVVMGRPWSEKNKPTEGAAGLYRKELARTPGEAFFRYKDGTLTIKAAKVVIDGHLEVTGDAKVAGDVEITGKADVTGDVETTGNLTAGGDLTVSGGIAVTGDTKATGNVDVGGNLEVAGGVTATGDVVAGSTSLTGHTHTESEGGTTSAPA